VEAWIGIRVIALSRWTGAYLMASLTQAVGEMVAERPARARVFEEVGIDCRGSEQQTLSEACWRRGIDPDLVLERLEKVDRKEEHDAREWSCLSQSALCQQLCAAHASFREELPRLGLLLYRLAEGDGDRYPELHRILQLFSLFSGELKLHMTKEEVILFPLIEELEGGLEVGDISILIERLETEHEQAADALSELRQLTHDFTPPSNACETYRLMLDDLMDLEHDLREHFDVENNILFSRACQREQQQFAAAL